MRSRLTKISEGIHLFPRLTQLNFEINKTNIIRAVEFNFKSPIVNNNEAVQIFLQCNRITYIEPGAFDGKLCRCLIIVDVYYFFLLTND